MEAFLFLIDLKKSPFMAGQKRWSHGLYGGVKCLSNSASVMALPICFLATFLINFLARSGNREHQKGK